MAKYPYFIVPENSLPKPWIQIRLGYRRTHKITPAPVIALIDSGADVCFCASNIGL